MKANKLFKKLALSGVALGAAAVTLTATTFAWYTQNNEVQVGAVSGLTSTTADTGSIYISAASTYTDNALNSTATAWTKYANSATPTPITGVSEGVAQSVLTPVTYNSYTKSGVSTGGTDGVYLPLAGATGTNKDEAQYGAYVATNIIQYRLRLRTASSGVATPIYLSGFSIANTVNSLPTLTALASEGGTAQNTAYGADLLKSLKLTVDQYAQGDASAVTADSDHSTYDTAGFSKAATSTTVYSFENYDAKTDVGLTGTVDALDYYKAVLGLPNLSRPTQPDVVSLQKPRQTAVSEETDLANALVFLTIPASGSVEVVFTFWLDGWDEYCFDCMRQQGFTCSMNFSSSLSDVRVLTTA